MNPKPNKLAHFYEGQFYHVFNRTNNKEALFLDDKDRLRFFDMYCQYLNGVADTYAYCLLPNHFHLLIKMKPPADLITFCMGMPQDERRKVENDFLAYPYEPENFHKVVVRQFVRFFTAYAKYFNKKHQRNGNLFHRPFKRIMISDDPYLLNAVFYIHNNPVKHKIYPNLFSYKWSSYKSIISDKKTNLQRDTLLNLFGSRPSFIDFHTRLPDDYNFYSNEIGENEDE